MAFVYDAIAKDLGKQLRTKFTKLFSKTPIQASFDDINWDVEGARP